MIASLDDAWKWYDAIRTLAGDMSRLAKKWDDPGLANLVDVDNRLRYRTAAELEDKANTILKDLDDLAVMMLFSVFEATVRDRAKKDVDREIELIRHPAVRRAVSDLKDAIENGSFGKVTDAYKKMDVDLTEQVNQVRRYRNWVAHGRRGEPENRVDPDRAIDRLGKYLTRLLEVESAGGLPPLPLEESRPDAETG
jgi:hypothetical protein